MVVVDPAPPEENGEGAGADDEVFDAGAPPPNKEGAAGAGVVEVVPVVAGFAKSPPKGLEAAAPAVPVAAAAGAVPAGFCPNAPRYQTRER